MIGFGRADRMAYRGRIEMGLFHFYLFLFSLTLFLLPLIFLSDLATLFVWTMDDSV